MKSDSIDELDRIFNAVTSVVSGQEGIGRPIDFHGRALTLKVAKATTAKVSGDTPRTTKSHHIKQATASSQCVLCKGKHNVMMCDEFMAKPATERKAVAETHRLCYNCFGSHQSAKTCLTCKARHHTMLHEAYATSKVPEANALSAVRKNDSTKAILLATARVNVADRHGTPHTVRALIDQGSEVSLIAESLVQRLHLPRSRSSVSIIGIGGIRTGSTRGTVTLNLSSTVNETELTVIAFILPRLSLYQSAVAHGKTKWPHVEGLQLADPRFQADDPIELLLGAEVCSIILEEGLRKGGPQTPVAQRTLLGWILSSGCGDTSSPTPRTFPQCTVEHEMVSLVQRFWEQEQRASPPVALTPDEQLCEDNFARTYTRSATGRYVVKLPFTSPPTTLGETRKPAKKLLHAMEPKYGLDSRFGELYRAFLKEYEDMSHMTPMGETSNSPSRELYYLPHHGLDTNKINLSTRFSRIENISVEDDIRIKNKNVIFLASCWKEKDKL
ncbi:PREDICTED: uncharacterized protein LOC105557010 [Vollenhovia emeryi]|uniref:uncharacterized protein LOC105557010 n=1 Tax=Vollenhovia emeryi TaxID=411798 RepID=UPI0005F518D0|nr:PREDICTED: uncharacterized protein LOC105557010 [Vollenhovia emeryi]